MPDPIILGFAPRVAEDFKMNKKQEMVPSVPNAGVSLCVPQYKH